MKRFVCIALLSAVGCTSVPTAPPTTPPAPTAPAAKEHGIQVWIPNFFADLWETVDARIGMDYGFGAHLKLTVRFTGAIKKVYARFVTGIDGADDGD